MSFHFISVHVISFHFSSFHSFIHSLIRWFIVNWICQGGSKITCVGFPVTGKITKPWGNAHCKPCLTTLCRVSASPLSHFMWVRPSPRTVEDTKSWLYSRGLSSNSALGWTGRIGMDIATPIRIPHPKARGTSKWCWKPISSRQSFMLRSLHLDMPTENRRSGSGCGSLKRPIRCQLHPATTWGALPHTAWAQWVGNLIWRLDSHALGSFNMVRFVYCFFAACGMWGVWHVWHHNGDAKIWAYWPVLRPESMTLLPSLSHPIQAEPCHTSTPGTTPGLRLGCRRRAWFWRLSWWGPYLTWCYGRPVVTLALTFYARHVRQWRKCVQSVATA